LLYKQRRHVAVALSSVAGGRTTARLEGGRRAKDVDCAFDLLGTSHVSEAIPGTRKGVTAEVNFAFEQLRMRGALRT